MAEYRGTGAPQDKLPVRLTIAAIVVYVVLLAIATLIAKVVSPGIKGNVPEEDTARLILPVAKLELGAAPAGPKGARTGEQVYQAGCAACHASGAAGAPMLGDKAAWAPRIGQGLEGLVKSATAGKGAMPPRGGMVDLSDAELARAIAFMTNQSGASFKEPAAK